MIRRVLACGVAAALLAACTLGSPTYISAEEAPQSREAGAPSSGGNGTGSTSSADSVATCGSDDFVKPDLSKLTACGDGKGHCFDKTKAPLASQLVPCADASQVCVPDEILAAGGGKLKSCTSIIGPGACVTSSLIPEVEKQGGSVLKQDVCAANQKCLPCTDPTHNNAPTPFCQPIGVHEKACAAGGGTGNDGGAAAAPLPGCCTTKGRSNGVCLSETAIPAAQRDKAKKDTCADGNKCVPASLVQMKPVKCTAGLLGAGVCMDKCFDDTLGFAGDIGILPKTGCGETEVCVPCSFVKDQGVPGCT